MGNHVCMGYVAVGILNGKNTRANMSLYGFPHPSHGHLRLSSVEDLIATRHVDSFPGTSRKLTACVTDLCRI